MADQITAIALALTALTTAILGLAKAIQTIWRRVSRQEHRIDLFWQSRLLRGTVEGLTKGLLVEQVTGDSIAPENEGGFMTVTTTPEAYRAYEPIAEKLKAIRAKNPDVGDTELAEIIEEKWGPWLSRFVCASLKISDYACLVMAVSVANGVPPADLPHNLR